MDTKKEKLTIIAAGLIIGLISSALVVFGNPANMGFCIACFLRDIAGGLGLHSAPVVQYIRPEIIGLVLGSFLLAFAKGEFRSKGGSSPVTRFILGFFVMTGCLMFLGCPFRMILRMAGGDLNALIGLAGFICGICVGIFFLKKGYTLKRTYAQPAAEGFVMPVIMTAFLVLLVMAPAFIRFSEEGLGSKHAAILISLAAGLIVGALAQHTRLCMVGGIRDMILFKENRLLLGFVTIFASALVCNLIFGAAAGNAMFNLSMAGQPVAHTDGIWNFAGMLLAGYGCVLLGGCPLRQLVLSGEGNSDSAVTVLGLITGAAFCHNFGLASSADGPTANGKTAVIIGLIVVTVIAAINTFKKEN